MKATMKMLFVILLGIAGVFTDNSIAAQAGYNGIPTIYMLFTDGSSFVGDTGTLTIEAAPASVQPLTGYVYSIYHQYQWVKNRDRIYTGYDINACATRYQADFVTPDGLRFYCNAYGHLYCLFSGSTCLVSGASCPDSERTQACMAWNVTKPPLQTYIYIPRPATITVLDAGAPVQGMAVRSWRSDMAGFYGIRNTDTAGQVLLYNPNTSQSYRFGVVDGFFNHLTGVVSNFSTYNGSINLPQQSTVSIINRFGENESGIDVYVMDGVAMDAQGVVNPSTEQAVNNYLAATGTNGQVTFRIPEPYSSATNGHYFYFEHDGNAYRTLEYSAPGNRTYYVYKAGRPTLTTPSNGGSPLEVGMSIPLEWENLSAYGAVYYRIYMKASGDSSFTSLGWATGTQASITSGLNAGDYQWLVRAYDSTASVEIARSSVNSFTVESSAEAESLKTTLSVEKATTITLNSTVNTENFPKTSAELNVENEDIFATPNLLKSPKKIKQKPVTPQTPDVKKFDKFPKGVHKHNHEHNHK